MPFFNGLDIPWVNLIWENYTQMANFQASAQMIGGFSGGGRT